MRRPGASRNPDTIYLFALCVFAGAGQVAAGTPPGSVLELLPLWAALAWGACLVVFGGVVLTGIFWRNVDRGEQIELVGRTTFGPFALSYAVAIASAQPSLGSGVLAAAPFVGLSIACAMRAWQIVKRLRRAVRQGR